MPVLPICTQSQEPEEEQREPEEEQREQEYQEPMELETSPSLEPAVGCEKSTSVALQDYGLTLPQIKGLDTCTGAFWQFRYTKGRTNTPEAQYANSDNTNFLLYGVKECLDQICTISKVTELPYVDGEY